MALRQFLFKSCILMVCAGCITKADTNGSASMGSIGPSATASRDQYAAVMLEMRNARITIDLDEAPLSEALELIRNESERPIFIDWSSIETLVERDFPITLHLRDVTVADALDAILKKFGQELETDVGYEVVPVVRVALRDHLPSRPNDIQTTAYNDQTADRQRIWEVHPTHDSTTKTGVHIPKNLDECFAELDRMIHPDLIKKMRSEPQTEMIQYHFGLGMWMRNNWELWGDSRLCKFFNNIGIQHPDDMSGIILNSYWAHLNGKPLDIEKQVGFYREYWQIKTQQPDPTSRESEEVDGRSGDE
jgi:hypothetical protein